MSDGYLSRDRQHLADLQRQRRARMVRIDYMPGPDALAVFQAVQAKRRPGSQSATNSAVLDSILTEWADLAGIKYRQESKPKSSASVPELADANARARMSSAPIPQWFLALAGKPAKPRRVPCGAQRHRDGQPCQALSEPGKRRCRFHGGRSTGPKTDAGKARALANLRQYRKPCPRQTDTR